MPRHTINKDEAKVSSLAWKISWIINEEAELTVGQIQRALARAERTTRCMPVRTKAYIASQADEAVEKRAYEEQTRLCRQSAALRRRSTAQLIVIGALLAILLTSIL